MQQRLRRHPVLPTQPGQKALQGRCRPRVPSRRARRCFELGPQRDGGVERDALQDRKERQRQDGVLAARVDEAEESRGEQRGRRRRDEEEKREEREMGGERRERNKEERSGGVEE